MAYNIQTDVDYQAWKAITENFSYMIHNFENSSYVIDKIIEEIVTTRIKTDDLEKEMIENENENENQKENDKEKEKGKEKEKILPNEKKVDVKKRKSIIASDLIPINEKENLNSNQENKNNISLPPLINSNDVIKTNNIMSNCNNKNNSFEKITDNNTTHNKVIPTLSFPRLMSNFDISQTEAIYYPDPDVSSCSDIFNFNIDTKNQDEIFEKMDDTVKLACNNDKEQFSKLYNVLYQIFEYLYPTLNEMRNQMKDNDNKLNMDIKKKKKKKDKAVENDVYFDLHTILCCDTSFFNIPIEAYLHYMLDINIVNREFSLNLFLHRLILKK